MSNITLKKVSIADVSKLQKIGMTTFSETFREFNTPENLNKYLVEKFGERQSFGWRIRYKSDE